jgi:hypothetical protein
VVENTIDDPWLGDERDYAHLFAAAVGAAGRRRAGSRYAKILHAEQSLPPLPCTDRLQVEAGIMSTRQTANGTITGQAGADSRGLTFSRPSTRVPLA